jgi:hypothetical protein
VPISESTEARQSLEHAITDALPHTGGRIRSLLLDLRSELTAVEQHQVAVPAVPGPPIAFEHVRTDDGGYRVFDSTGVGTGAVTYDPNYGDIGIVMVDGPLSTHFDPAMEARICRDISLIRDEAAVFDRLEYVYRRQAARTTRPNATGVDA